MFGRLHVLFMFGRLIQRFCVAMFAYKRLWANHKGYFDKNDTI